jgi:hypothetical protein
MVEVATEGSHLAWWVLAAVLVALTGEAVGQRDGERRRPGAHLLDSGGTTLRPMAAGIGDTEDQGDDEVSRLRVAAEARATFRRQRGLREGARGREAEPRCTDGLH